MIITTTAESVSDSAGIARNMFAIIATTATIRPVIRKPPRYEKSFFVLRA